MRPTASSLAKASRLPLTSKKGNKNFYKGTGAANVLQRRRVALVNRNTGEALYDNAGNARTWNKQLAGRLDESRMVSYVVPPGLADTKLQPYVFTGLADDGGVPRPSSAYPGLPKGARLSTTKRGPGSGGMDGAFYANILDAVMQRRAQRSEAEADLEQGRRSAKASKQQKQLQQQQKGTTAGKSAVPPKSDAESNSRPARGGLRALFGGRKEGAEGEKTSR